MGAAACFAAGGPLEARSDPAGPIPGNAAPAFKYRTGFGVFANDMRNEPLPLEEWPTSIMDDQTVEGIVSVLDLQQRNGWNMIDIAGFFPMSNGDGGWPVDFTKVADPARRGRINRVLTQAHQRAIKVIWIETGVLSSGVDSIIKADPSVKGTSNSAMCPAREKSWWWMEKIYDYALDNFDVDGFHLESADRGRCRCEECLKRWPRDAEYHRYVTTRAANYLRSKSSKLFLAVTLFGWTVPKVGFTNADIDDIVELSRKVDMIWDQGHQGLLIPRGKDIQAGLRQGYPREEFVKRLHCVYGTSGGGVWMYPPHRWDRSSWFLPYTKRIGNATREDYQAGARGSLYYLGPVSNPSTEVNIAFAGRMLCAPSRNSGDVLSEVIADIYQPRNDAAHRKLVEIFQLAEEIYFGQWVPERWMKAWGTVGPVSEFYMDELFGNSPGPAGYLDDLYLGGPDGRLAYKKGLASILKMLPDIENDFNDHGRLEKIKRSIIFTLMLVNTFSQGRNEVKVYRTGPL